jgi:hypothetical protein
MEELEARRGIESNVHALDIFARVNLDAIAISLKSTVGITSRGSNLVVALKTLV